MYAFFLSVLADVHISTISTSSKAQSFTMTSTIYITASPTLFKYNLEMHKPISACKQFKTC